MVLTLIDVWLSYPDLINSDHIDEAYQTLIKEPPTGANQCLLAALSLIRQNQREGVLLMLEKYENQRDS